MTRCRYAVVLFLLGFSCHAQNQPDARVAQGFNRIRASDLRADLTFLSSDALEGRMSLDRGSEVAIQFIAAEYAKAGLKPLIGDSYLQPIELIRFLPDPQQTDLVLRQAGKERHYTFMTDFYGFFPHDVTVSAPVVFAGYGITAPEFGYDDYANVDVKGKIVLVFDHEPQENDPNSIFNGLGNTRHANARLKALNAQRHGAVGLLIASEPNRKHPSNIERLSRIPGIVERITHVPSQALTDSEVNIPSFNISDAVAETLLAASAKKGSELQSSIDASLKPSSVSLADTQITMKVSNSEMQRGMTDNVVGMIEGSDPKLKNETIILSGHYDHDGVRNGQIFHGADDNGSGTVGVIELARAFAANPAKPKRSLVFIVFAAEERGLLGSYYYAAHPLRLLDTTRAVINFDMIGRNEAPSAQTEGLMKIGSDTSNELNLIGTVNSSDYRAVVEREDEMVGLHLNYKWDDDAALNVFQRSDQFPFAVHDIPAMWWFTGFHPDYHQPTDTVEKINFGKMEKIVRLAYLSAWVFADESSVPRFDAVMKRK
jgi:Zn-dependent M28 family amino/carboxypeptidase